MSTPRRLACLYACLVAAAFSSGLGYQGRAQFQWGCYGFMNLHFDTDPTGELVSAPFFDGAGRLLEGATFLAMLYGGPTANVLRPVPPALPFQTGTMAGFMPKNGVDIVRQVPGVEPGTDGTLQVRAWNVRLGATYEEVAQRGLGGYGESDVFVAKSGCDFQAGLGYLDGLKSFSLRPVVSPVVFAREQGQRVFIDWVGDLPRYQLEQKRRMDEPWVPLGDPVTTNSFILATTNAAQFIRVVALPR